MRMAIVRSESTLNNFFTDPFEVGLRHFKVAFCDGSQDALLELARERIIYRPYEKDGNVYEPLTIDRRIFHIIIGTLNTVGYLTLVIPFIVLAAQKFFSRPMYLKGCYGLRTHMAEGGAFGSNSDHWRKNPFDQNGAEDPFYQGASWLPKDCPIGV